MAHVSSREHNDPVLQSDLCQKKPVWIGKSVRSRGFIRSLRGDTKTGPSSVDRGALGLGLDAWNAPADLAAVLLLGVEALLEGVPLGVVADDRGV